MNTTEKALKRSAEALHDSSDGADLEGNRHEGHSFLGCQHQLCIDARAALAAPPEVNSILKAEAIMLGVGDCTLQGFSTNEIDGAPTVRTVVYRTEPDPSRQQQIRVCAWADGHQLFSTFIGPQASASNAPRLVEVD